MATLTRRTSRTRPLCPNCRADRLLTWRRGEYVCPSCTRFAPAPTDDEPDPAGPGAVAGLPVARPTANWPGVARAA